MFPDEFIPLTEESGLIEPLTNWVVNKVIQQCQIFHAKNKDLKFSINLSSFTLNDPVFPDELLKVTKLHKIPPQNICLEVTESGVSHKSEIILEVLTKIRMLGFSLSIDDFGTGYSSIVELQRLPFTELKVDKRFVLDLLEKNTEIIVRSIIELGHNLDLVLVAEGVENQQIFDRLVELNCDIAQGYHIAKGLSIEDLEKWYTAHINEDLTWHL